MTDVFLSYAHEDRDWARSLATALETRGWSTWWDRRIPAGGAFRDVIAKALSDARCVVAIWSGASLKSTWVQEEADEARRRGILIPVLKDSVLPPLGFRSTQAADLTAWIGAADDPTFAQLCADIGSLLASTPPVRPIQDNPEQPIGIQTAPEDAEAFTRNELPAATPPQTDTDAIVTAHPLFRRRHMLGLLAGTGGLVAAGILIYNVASDRRDSNAPVPPDSSVQDSGDAQPLETENEDRIDTTLPTRGFTFSPSEPSSTDQLTITATATDDVRLEKIEIYVAWEGQWHLVKTCQGSPCTWTGGPFSRGTVALNAIAYDAAKNQYPSSPGTWEQYVQIH